MTVGPERNNTLINENPAPKPNNPPNTMPMLPKRISPLLSSMMARMIMGVDMLRIHSPNTGASGPRSLLVAKANRPMCSTPRRNSVAGPPEAHCFNGP